MPLQRGKRTLSDVSASGLQAVHNLGEILKETKLNFSMINNIKCWTTYHGFFYEQMFMLFIEDHKQGTTKFESSARFCEGGQKLRKEKKKLKGQILVQIQALLKTVNLSLKWHKIWRMKPHHGIESSSKILDTLLTKSSRQKLGFDF